jgi:hypothetical protein
MGLDIRLYAEIDEAREEVFTDGETHNCVKMAEAAGIYKHVWRPEECNDIKIAGDLIEPLQRCIAIMKNDPAKFIALNPTNGWGSYDTFLPFLERYLAACIKYPKSEIYASR